MYQFLSDSELAQLIIEKSKQYPFEKERYQELFEEVFETERDPRSLELYRAITIFNCNYDAYLWTIGEKRSFSATFIQQQIKQYYEAGGGEEIAVHFSILQKSQELIYSSLYHYEKSCRVVQLSQMIQGSFRKFSRVRVGTFLPDIYIPRAIVDDELEKEDFSFLSFGKPPVLKK